MSIVITLEEIEFFRADLADHRAALDALQVIEDCDGDLEDAAISLAIRSGQEPDTNERWIEGLAKRWRHILCAMAVRDGLEDGLSGRVIDAIVEHTELPTRLAVPVAIYVVKTGVKGFCQPLEEKIA